VAPAVSDAFDYEKWRFWFEISQGVFNVLIVAYVWWSNRNRAHTSALQAVNDRITEDKNNNTERFNDIERGIERIDQELGHLPDKGYYEGLEQRLDNVSQKLAEATTELSSTTNLLNTLHRYLLEKS